MVKLKSLLNITVMVLVFSINGCMNVDRIIIEDINLQNVKDGQYTGATASSKIILKAIENALKSD